MRGSVTHMPKYTPVGRKSALEVNMDLPKSFDRMCQSVWKSYNQMFGDLQRAGMPVSESACKSYYYGHTEPRLSTGYAILQLISALSDREIEQAKSRLEAVRNVTRYVG